MRETKYDAQETLPLNSYSSRTTSLFPRQVLLIHHEPRTSVSVQNEKKGTPRKQWAPQHGPSKTDSAPHSSGQKGQDLDPQNLDF